MDSLKFKTDMAFAYGEPSPMGPGIVRIVANNPSPLTFKGTNTYLVGSTSLAVIDAGPDDPAHREAILKAAGAAADHAHHFDARASRPCRRRRQAQGRNGRRRRRFPRDPEAGRIALKDSPSGKYFVDYDFQPDIALKGGDTISGGDWALTAIHTPGHAPDHLCFALEGRPVVFSGDHVMAWNTTVVAPPEGRMADYVGSLEILLDRQDDVFLPGHGGRIVDPQRTVKAYLLHRRWREKSVLDALAAGATTIRRIVPEIYQGLAPADDPGGDAFRSSPRRISDRERSGRLRFAFDAGPRPFGPLRLAAAALAFSASFVGVRHRSLEPGRDLLQHRAHALGIAAEIVLPVARRRAHVDARRLILAEHANDDVVDETENERVVGKLDEARASPLPPPAAVRASS